MTDPLVTLFDPVLQPLAHRLGLEAACIGIARLLNAAALDALCGHSTHGDRLLDAVAGRDVPPSLRRRLAQMVSGRRSLWPDDRRVLRDWDFEHARGGVLLKTRCEDLDVRGAAELAVRLLVEVPPASVGELEARLRGLRRPSVRAALRRALEAVDLPDEIVEIVGAAFDAVGGPGRQLRPLVRVATDEGLPPQRREAAWRVIMGCPDDEVDVVLHDVDPVHQQELTGLGLGAMLRRIVGSPRAAELLRDQLRELPAGTRRDLFAGMEAVRSMEGIPAAALYGAFLAARCVPELDELVVPALVADGGPAAEEALILALAAEDQPIRERVLRRGLLDLRTARIEPREEAGAQARAWIGVCDGQAAFPVLMATRNERMRHRLASVVVRCGAEVRDGFVADDLDVERLEQLVSRYGEIAELVEVAPAVAAAWVADGLEATDGGLPGLPAEIGRAVDEILRHYQRDEGLPVLTSDRVVPTLASCRELFLRPTLHSWFLDAADLSACGIPLPPVDAGDAVAWTRDHAARIIDPRVRERLTAMVSHLARLLGRTGESEHAALAAAIARDLERGDGAPFLRVILEQTALASYPSGAVQSIPLRFGDEGLREDVRRYLDPAVPRMRDLAALDVVDLLLSCEQDLFMVDVDAARVRPDVRRAALRAAGVQLAASVGAGDAEDLAGDLHRALRSTGVPEPAVEPVGSQILLVLTQFLHDVCQDCPVQCWNAPRAAAGRAWDGPGHPAFIG